MIWNQYKDAPRQTAEKLLTREVREQRLSTDTTEEHKDQHTSTKPPHISGNRSSERGDLEGNDERPADNIHRVLDARLERTMGSLTVTQCQKFLGSTEAHPQDTGPGNQETRGTRKITRVQNQPGQLFRGTDKAYPPVQGASLTRVFPVEGARDALRNLEAGVSAVDGT